MVAQTLESNLRSAGVRAIVTSRAKNPARLEAKVKQRNVKRQYDSVSTIFDDIVDLAGVRVALYFPGERQEVGHVIQNLFELTETPKEFPTSAEPTYKKRFSGYWATHYRVVMKESSLHESHQRYAEAKVEIQVASVLMHAWSEVEHDLVYKPLQGQLSAEEYSILDELNGLVLSGEIALERLQRAGELRASTQGREFSNHYDLAASLVELARLHLGEATVTESAMGRVDNLFELLKALNLNTPDALVRYVQPLHSDFEKRPLSNQVIDQILSEDAERYLAYEKIRRNEAVSPLAIGTTGGNQQREALGEFIELWIAYEKEMRSFAPESKYNPPMPPMKLIHQLNPKLGGPIFRTAKRLQQIRNLLIHGIDVPAPESIKAASEDLRELMRQIQAVMKGVNSVEDQSE